MNTELGLIRLAAVLQATGLSRAQIYLLMRENRFPRGVKLGRATAWVRKEVIAWIEQRIAERDAELAL